MGRERLQRLAIRGLVDLSRIYEAAGDYPEAIENLERALVFNPLQEDLQRENILLLYLSGDRPAAIRRYDQLRKLLDEEMGVPPMVETRSLYDAIINDKLMADPLALDGQPGMSLVRGAGVRTPDSTAVSRSTLPFTGRQVELQSLMDLSATRKQDLRPKLALIEGEAGR